MNIENDLLFRLFDDGIILLSNRILVAKTLKEKFHIKRVELSFCPSVSDAVVLDFFEIYKSYQMQGNGSLFVKTLAEWLKKNGKVLCLTPNALYEKDLNVKYLTWLKSFYVKLGFIYNEGSDYNNHCSKTMYYHPEGPKEMCLYV